MSLIKINSKFLNKSFHIDKENIHLFFYFIWKRQDVYYNRFVLKQDPPWTDDEILLQYKFTNIYRELDRTTIWYQDTIGKFESEQDIIFATFVHRLFNKIETMQLLLPYLTVRTFNIETVKDILDNYRNEGFGVFTSAHLTTGVRFGGYDDKLDNILYLVDLIHKDMKNIYKSIKSSKSLEDLYNKTREVNGFGPFLGYQFILDMINTGVCKFSHDDFVVAGPGCKRGIRHIFPNANEITFEESMIWIRRNQHKYFEKYGFDFKFIEELGGKEKGIHLANVENSMCEYSKYWKTYHGTGRPRNKFIATDKPIRIMK